MFIKKFAFMFQADTGSMICKKVCNSLEEARKVSDEQLRTSIKALFGEDFVVPAKCIDEDGYIEYYQRTGNDEINSNEWTWSMHKGDYSIRGEIDPVEVELTLENMEAACHELRHIELLEDAEHAYFEYIGYMPEDHDMGENSPVEARNSIVNNYMIEHYGFSAMDAVDQTKPKNFLLEELVEMFEQRETSSLSNDMVWQQVVEDLLIKKKKK